LFHLGYQLQAIRVILLAGYRIPILIRTLIRIPILILITLRRLPLIILIITTRDPLHITHRHTIHLITRRLPDLIKSTI
jgi:hypothetical protein